MIRFLLSFGLLTLLAFAGCTPSSGGATRTNDDTAAPGAGTASLTWPIGKSERQPSDNDVNSARSGPVPPARSDE
ncbi:MAG: hypothetical protein H7Z14_14920 [Anaerolineae bacterium]|nr:hypothetical protein [Phycisphaerae bacterium]